MKNNNRIHVILVLVLGLVSVNANAAPVSGQGSWETTLQGRDLDGNLSTAEAYYDTILNITWLGDANYAQTSGYGAANVGGLMTWDVANAWTANLNINGYTGWRLPNTAPVNGMYFNEYYSGRYNGASDMGANISAPGSVYPGSTASEMAYMFYNTLGNAGFYDITGTLTGCEAPNHCLTNTGPFSNLLSQDYWSISYNETRAWYFHFNFGIQSRDLKGAGIYTWVVHSGDVGIAAATTTVPIPAAFWLFGSALAGLFGIARKNH